MKETIKLGKLITVTPGLRHAWFESNVGKVRKPLATNPLDGHN